MKNVANVTGKRGYENDGDIKNLFYDIVSCAILRVERLLGIVTIRPNNS